MPGKIPNVKEQSSCVADIKATIEKSTKNNGIVLFQDPMHQIHNNENGYCWQKKGKEGTKQILSNSGRQRINIVGALNPVSLFPTALVSESNCDQEMIKVFFEEIRKEYPQSKHNKIYIFLDNATYHKAYAVQDKAKELGIILKYLPPYTPNLNLIERLWKFFKSKVVKNRYYQTFDEFQNTIIKFFQNYKQYLPELRKLLTLKFEIIKAT